MSHFAHLDYLISYNTNSILEHNIIVEEISKYFNSGDENYLSTLAKQCLRQWEVEMEISV